MSPPGGKVTSGNGDKRGDPASGPEEVDLEAWKRAHGLLEDDDQVEEGDGLFDDVDEVGMMSIQMAALQIGSDVPWAYLLWTLAAVALLNAWVAFGPHPERSFTAAAGVRVTTDPPGVEVLVDATEESLGLTPVHLSPRSDVPGGRLRLRTRDGGRAIVELPERGNNERVDLDVRLFEAQLKE